MPTFTLGLNEYEKIVANQYKTYRPQDGIKTFKERLQNELTKANDATKLPQQQFKNFLTYTAMNICCADLNTAMKQVSDELTYPDNPYVSSYSLEAMERQNFDAQITNETMNITITQPLILISSPIEDKKKEIFYVGIQKVEIPVTKQEKDITIDFDKVKITYELYEPNLPHLQKILPIIAGFVDFNQQHKTNLSNGIEQIKKDFKENLVEKPRQYTSLKYRQNELDRIHAKLTNNKSKYKDYPNVSVYLDKQIKFITKTKTLSNLDANTTYAQDFDICQTFENGYPKEIFRLLKLEDFLQKQITDIQDFINIREETRYGDMEFAHQIRYARELKEKLEQYKNQCLNLSTKPEIKNLISSDLSVKLLAIKHTKPPIDLKQPLDNLHTKISKEIKLYAADRIQKLAAYQVEFDKYIKHTQLLANSLASKALPNEYENNLKTKVSEHIKKINDTCKEYKKIDINTDIKTHNNKVREELKIPDKEVAAHVKQYEKDYSMYSYFIRILDSIYFFFHKSHISVFHDVYDYEQKITGYADTFEFFKLPRQNTSSSEKITPPTQKSQPFTFKNL